MTTRGLNSAEIAAGEAPSAIVAPLVEVLFDGGPLRLAMGGMSVTHNGITWTATGGLLSVEPATESADRIDGFSFQLSGLETAFIEIAANEPYRGRVVRIYEAWFTDAMVLIAPPRVEWLGRLASLSIEESQGKVTVSGAVEHYEADLYRPRVRRYSAADQRRRYPDDLGCDLLESMVDAQIVWPNKEIQRR